MRYSVRRSFRGLLMKRDILVGVRAEEIGSKDELNAMVTECKGKLQMQLQYHIPSPTQKNGYNVKTKTVDVLLQRDRGGFGIVVRGGYHDDPRKCRPLIVTHVRHGSPADVESTVRPGDRLVCVNGFDLTQSTVPEVNDMMFDSGNQAVVRIEYDVAIMESVRRATGPLLVELAKTPYSRLGVKLVTAQSVRGGPPAVLIDSIRPASVADRCGALHVGDQILAVNGESTKQLCAEDVINMLQASPEDTKIEILPARQARRRYNTGSMSTHGTPYSTVRRSRGGLMGPPRQTSPCTRSVYSFSTVGRGGGGQPWPRTRSVAGSMTSLASAVSNMSLPFQISRAETAIVNINSQGHPSGFGLSLYSFESYPNEPLKTPPMIDFVEPDGPAQRTGLIHVGDRVLAINGRTTLDTTLNDINDMMRDAGPKITLKTQFDVAESVVPSSGSFTVKLAKAGNKIGLRLYAMPYRRPGEGLWILDVIPGSVAHRTGTIAPGDRIQSINGIPLRDKSVEDAYTLLRSPHDNIIRLLVEKDEEYSEDGPNGNNLYTIELRPNGGRLGITLSGSDEPFEPIVIAAIEPGSTADRIDVLHVNDQLVAINGVNLRGRNVGDAVAMLQNVTTNVQLKICRKFTNGHQESGFSSMRSETQGFTTHSDWSTHMNTPSKTMDPVAGLSHALQGLQTSLETPALVNGGSHMSPDMTSQVRRHPILATSTPKDIPGDVSRYISAYGTPMKSYAHQRQIPKCTNNNNYTYDTATAKRRHTTSETAIQSEGFVHPQMEDIGLQSKELLKFYLQKDATFRDFGFSVSNGEQEPGVFINSVRPGGLAELTGIKPLDKLVQINSMKLAPEETCENIVPVIANSGTKVELVIERGVDCSSTSSVVSVQRDTVLRHPPAASAGGSDVTQGVTSHNNSDSGCSTATSNGDIHRRPLNGN